MRIAERVLNVYLESLTEKLTTALAAQLRGIRNVRLAVGVGLELVARLILLVGGVFDGEDYIARIGFEHAVVVVVRDLRARNGKLAALSHIRRYARAVVVDAQEVFLVERDVHVVRVRIVAVGVRNGIIAYLLRGNGVILAVGTERAVEVDRLIVGRGNDGGNARHSRNGNSEAVAVVAFVREHHVGKQIFVCRGVSIRRSVYERKARKHDRKPDGQCRRGDTVLL